MRWKSLLTLGAASWAATLPLVMVQPQVRTQVQADSDLDKPSTTNNIVMTSIRWYPKYPTF